jgi:hypothetical protein
VIAWRNGSVPEVVADGETGFIVSSVEEMAAAVDRVGELAPRAMRAWVEQRFSADAMVAGYERVYQQVLAHDGRSGSSPAHPTTAAPEMIHAAAVGLTMRLEQLPGDQGWWRHFTRAASACEKVLGDRSNCQQSVSKGASHSLTQHHRDAVDSAAHLVGCVGARGIAG